MRLARMALICAAAVLACGCQKNYTAYALTSTGSIIKFDSSKPGTISNTVSVSGLGSGASLVQLTYRPANATLYGLGSDNRLYTVDGDTGAVAVVDSTEFTADTLSSAIIGFDPVADQMRVMSTEYNLRVAADGTLQDTGTKAAFDSGDTNSGKTPQLAAIAYDNPVSGASSTTLFALDVTTQTLLRVGNAGVSSTSSADGGDLHTIGSVGVSFTSDAGLSVQSGSSTAYAALQQSGSGAVLYTIDLSTGAASKVGTIGSGDDTLISLVLIP